MYLPTLQLWWKTPARRLAIVGRGPQERFTELKMFCDVCGIKFEDGALRPKSRYCPKCGETLLKWIVDAVQANQPPQREQCIVQRNENPQSLRRLSPVAQEPFGSYNEEEDLYGVPPNSNPRNAAPLAVRSPLPSPSVESSSSETYDGYSDYRESDAASTDNDAESIRSISDFSLELSLDIRDHNLPPPFPVPQRYNQAFPRRIIAKLLGGSPQNTYPVGRDRCHPMYACPKMSNNPTLPTVTGAHGILITRPVPKELVLSFIS